MKKFSKVMALCALTCVWGGGGAPERFMLQQFWRRNNSDNNADGHNARAKPNSNNFYRNL